MASSFFLFVLFYFFFFEIVRPFIVISAYNLCSKNNLNKLEKKSDYPESGKGDFWILLIYY